MSDKSAGYFRRKREKTRRAAREFIRQCREKGIHPESIGKTGSMKMEKR